VSGKVIIFSVLFAALIIFSTTNSAWAAQLETRINPDHITSDFKMTYQRVIFIEYDEGGQIADLLRQSSWATTLTADSSDPGVADLIQKLNAKLRSDGSGAQISDLNVDYSVTLTGRGLNTAIDYKVVLNGSLSGYIIKKDQIKTLIDMGWRGMSVDAPIVIKGVEINLPSSALEENEGTVFSHIAGTEADSIMNAPLINADGIKNQPLTNWHFLFDPTGINVDASTFGLAEEISGFVVSGFTMGESSLREGRQVEQIKEASFTVDRNYIVRSVQSADSANIQVIGFAVIDSLDGVEIMGVTPTPPEGFATTSTGGFPVGIIYGMAGMAAIGGGAIFIISNRKLKAEKGQTEQTGIDPSRLRAYQTSAGSGGYQTVRGEAQLIDDSGYQQSRSVYDEQKPDESSKEPQSKKGALPKGF